MVLNLTNKLEEKMTEKNLLGGVFNALKESQKRPNYEVYTDDGLVLETPSRSLAFKEYLKHDEKNINCVIYRGEEVVQKCSK